MVAVYSLLYVKAVGVLSCVVSKKEPLQHNTLAYKESEFQLPHHTLVIITTSRLMNMSRLIQKS